MHFLLSLIGTLPVAAIALPSKHSSASNSTALLPRDVTRSQLGWTGYCMNFQPGDDKAHSMARRFMEVRGNPVYVVAPQSCAFVSQFLTGGLWLCNTGDRTHTRTRDALLGAARDIESHCGNTSWPDKWSGQFFFYDDWDLSLVAARTDKHKDSYPYNTCPHEFSLGSSKDVDDYRRVIWTTHGFGTRGRVRPPRDHVVPKGCHDWRGRCFDCTEADYDPNGYDRGYGPEGQSTRKYSTLEQEGGKMDAEGKGYDGWWHGDWPSNHA